MIAQLNSACPHQMAQPGLGMPALGGNFALDRLGVAAPPSALLQQSMQTGQVLLQMMTMLLGLMAAGGASGGSSGGGGSVGSVSGGGGGGVSSSGGGGGGGTSATGKGGNVDPSSVKDKTGTSGLNASSKRGLEEAHKWGLPLVSGKRSGGGTSDHDHGNAIDVGTLPIGAASSNGGTQQMKEFAEHMRQEGKAGRLNVKYIIRDGQIASSRDNWAWRPYIYPGKTQAQLDALKRSNPGEYNRIQHFDHVHVSFN
ncbi:MAG: hypothetical protein J0I12_33500 [Candidatus Eremiobacteraeota bacterium]|nr:hypothetical protein [Candidatus Eremiobacteraeota bacterium]